MACQWKLKSVQLPVHSNVMTILIIEDNAILAKNIGRILKQRGLVTHIASSIDEAHQLYRRCDFTAICLDLQLPDGHGLSFLDDLVKAGRQLPAVVMTGTGTEVDRQQASKLGVTSFLIKPFALAALEEALNDAMGISAPAKRDTDDASQSESEAALLPGTAVNC